MTEVAVVITNSEDATADYVCSQAESDGASLVRWNTDQRCDEIEMEFSLESEPWLQLQEKTLKPQEISGVWYRRPKALPTPSGMEIGVARHARLEWREALEGMFRLIVPEKWINYPVYNQLASSKIEQLRRASRYRLSVPDTLVTQEIQALRNFWSRHDGALISKPLSMGFIERENPEDDTLIYTNDVPRELLNDASALRTCPTLFQRRIDKEFDVRITLIDETLHSVKMTARDEEKGIQRTDVRRNNMTDVDYDPIKVPAEVATSLLQLCRSYKLRFAAVDFAVDTSGKWWFFEINPNGQWAWLDILGETDATPDLLRALGQ